MRCAKARKMISEGIDGDLEAAAVARLERHLRDCADCRKVKDDLAALVRAAQALETPAPSDRVWAGIRAGLAGSRRRGAVAPGWSDGRVRLPGVTPVLRWAAVGAAALVLVAGGIFVGRSVLRQDGPAFANKAGMGFTLAKLDEAETHYRLAIQALDEAAAAQKAHLSPGMAELVGQELGAIDELIKTAEDAVRRDPADLKARAYLLNAFRNKVELLEAAVEIGRRAAPSAPAGAKI
ncbi:MAG: zf-HC2 domain-containing protein [Candidatus Aminicenantes bacterium]|nr:zf-HC2 domain-containing protein [Candidatus Aminicenantes bacterium]